MIKLQIPSDAMKALMNGYKAGIVYVARQRRAIHPHGDFDSAGRWFPCAKTERRRCCDQIRPPSRRWPYSLMLHCRTAKHVARLFSAPEKHVRRAAKAFTNMEERELAVEAEKALRSGS